MKEILELIEIKKQDFSQLPLFEFMQDSSIHPRKRLSFAPCLTPLVMGFADLCKYIFRNENTSDSLQKLINQHTYEEQSHWKWLLEDLQKLGYNSSQNYTDTLRFLWGEETRKTRQVCPLLQQYAVQDNPIYKLVVVEVAEVTANVFFSITKKVALELQEITKQEYRYFGNCHLDQEINHNINQLKMVQFLETIQLTDEIRNQVSEVVEKVFEAYAESMHELLAYAQNSEVFLPATAISAQA